MGIEDIAKSGKPMSLGEVQALVEKRKRDDVAAEAKKKIYPINYSSPSDNLNSLDRGISLIEDQKPEHAKLLKTMLILCQQFGQTRDEAIAIVAGALRKPIHFVELREREAIGFVRDRLDKTPLIIPA